MVGVEEGGNGWGWGSWAPFNQLSHSGIDAEVERFDEQLAFLHVIVHRRWLDFVTERLAQHDIRLGPLGEDDG